MNKPKYHRPPALDHVENEVIAVAEQIKPCLAGKDPEVQSAILAELLATLLASQFVPDDPVATGQLRSAIFGAHCMLVTELTQVNARLMGTDDQ